MDLPVQGITYVGLRERSAWREQAGEHTPITAAAPTHVVRIVVSRSHSTAATEAFVAGLVALFPRVERTSNGSSIKLCRVAEGSALLPATSSDNGPEHRRRPGSGGGGRGRRVALWHA